MTSNSTFGKGGAKYTFKKGVAKHRWERWSQIHLWKRWSQIYVFCSTFLKSRGGAKHRERWSQTGGKSCAKFHSTFSNGVKSRFGYTFPKGVKV